MKAFHEYTPTGQIGMLLGMMSMLGIPTGGIILVGAETMMDTTFQTDIEANAFQSAITLEVAGLSESVENNTTTLKQAVESVDSLNLTVLNIQVNDLEREIAVMEQDKRNNPTAWSIRDESTLNNKRRLLDDLNRQRQRVFDRVNK